MRKINDLYDTMQEATSFKETSKRIKAINTKKDPDRVHGIISTILDEERKKTFQTMEKLENILLGIEPK